MQQSRFTKWVSQAVVAQAFRPAIAALKRCATAVLAIVLVGAPSTRFAAQGSDELARRQYESGVAFTQNGRYAEALKDFQVVVDSFPQSTVADDALLQIALYQLEVAHDLP